MAYTIINIPDDIFRYIIYLFNDDKLTLWCMAQVCKLWRSQIPYINYSGSYQILYQLVISRDKTFRNTMISRYIERRHLFIEVNVGYSEPHSIFAQIPSDYWENFTVIPDIAIKAYIVSVISGNIPLLDSAYAAGAFINDIFIVCNIYTINMRSEFNTWAIFKNSHYYIRHNLFEKIKHTNTIDNPRNIIFDHILRAQPKSHVGIMNIIMNIIYKYVSHIYVMIHHMKN
jgi:hypothetical protein